MYCKTGGIIIGQNWESYHNDMRIYRHIQSFKTRQKSGFIDPSIDLFLKILRGVFFVKDKTFLFKKMYQNYQLTSSILSGANQKFNIITVITDETFNGIQHAFVHILKVTRR